MMTEQLPAHTRLSASSAKQFINCPGSVALRAEGPFPEDAETDSEWSREGTAAHDLAKVCLQGGSEPWMHIGDKLPCGTAVSENMSLAVQVYTDYVRGLHTTYPMLKGFCETRVDDKEFHPDFGGTADYYAYPTTMPAGSEDPALIVVDYKHGVGVPVAVEHNEQAMYYAYGIIRKIAIGPKKKVRLVIVQPRAPFGKPIQEWDTTAGELRDWALNVLKPAMLNVDKPNAPLSAGDWCQFCDRRLRCPVLNAQFDELAEIAAAVPGLNKSTKSVNMDNARMAKVLELVPTVRFLMTAMTRDGERRLMAGETIHGQKLVSKQGDRVWKPEAKAQLIATFGEDAWTKPELKSPAVIEKLPGGEEIVARHAYKPDTGLTMAPEKDRRQSQKPPTGASIFNVDKIQAEE